MNQNTKQTGDPNDILVISDDVVGDKMAGPGIRAWELSRVLARTFKVSLAIPDYSPTPASNSFFDGQPFHIVRYSVGDHQFMRDIAGKSRIVIFQGFILEKFPELRDLPALLVADLYVPFLIENMFIHKRKTPKIEDREFLHDNDLRVFHRQLLDADHFLCANDRQRDLFLGSLLALNRAGPRAIDESPAADGLISIVPFGLSPADEDVRADRDRRTGGFPYPVAADDILFLWGGVMSNWFDPLTLIEAFNRAVRKNGSLKLLFLSTGHPNPLLPEFDMARETVRLADRLGLKDRHVFFNEGWVGYRERGIYFRRADVGLSIHATNLETRFAFRTRILDYFKYGVPVLSTRGDSLSEFVEREAAGLTVSPGNIEELEAAILKLAGDPDLREKMRARIQLLKPGFYWEIAARPLVLFCRRVLEGSVSPRTRPRPQNLGARLQPRQDGPIRRLAHSRFLWPILQKLPPRLAVRLKRLLK